MSTKSLERAERPAKIHVVTSDGAGTAAPNPVTDLEQLVDVLGEVREKAREVHRELGGDGDLTSGAEISARLSELNERLERGVQALLQLQAGMAERAERETRERAQLGEELAALRQSLLARDRKFQRKRREGAGGGTATQGADQPRAGGTRGEEAHEDGGSTTLGKWTAWGKRILGAEGGRKKNVTEEGEAAGQARGEKRNTEAEDRQKYYHLNREAVTRAGGAWTRQPRRGWQSGAEGKELPFFGGEGELDVPLWRLLWDRGFLRTRAGTSPPPLNRPFGTAGAMKFVFAGHEASRTGAPLVLLNLMRHMAKLPGVELYLFLDRDGPILDDFVQVAHVVVNDRDTLFSYQDLSIPRLLEQLAAPKPCVSFCNSAEVWRFMREMHAGTGMKRFSLIDERLTHYIPDVHAVILENSDSIVFPSEAMRQVAIGIDPRFEASRVIPHGLMIPEFGTIDREAARRRVREELGIGPEAKIVLACGTLDLRKGTDLFVQLAERVIHSMGEDVHFIWMGGSATGPAAYDQRKWTLHDARLLKLESRVHFVGAKTDPEPYYMAADIFVLPSRDDPFPCVIQEAMAAALPIIAFAGAGGTPEALVDGCGLTVPYLDVEAMANSVRDLLRHPERIGEIGGKAEERVRRVYTFETFADRIIRLAMESLADRTSVP